MFYFIDLITYQDFPILAPRIFGQNEEYGIVTLNARLISLLINQENVWISYEEENIRLIKHFSQFNLNVAKIGEQERFAGLLVRKNLEKKLKSRLVKL